MSSSSRNLPGEWLLLSAAMLWGTNGTAQALAPDGATPLAVGLLRLAIGGGIMMITAIINGSFSSQKPFPRLKILLVAALVASYQVCFFAGVDRAGVAIGTIVGIGSAPVLAGALGWLFYREKPGLRWAISTALAVVGCILLALPGRQINFNPWGILLALGAGLSYAAYSHIGKRILEQHAPDAVMALVFFIGALLLSPAFLIVDLTWLGQTKGLLIALHLGLVTTALANFLYGRGLKLVPASHAVTLSVAEPLTAGLLGIFVLGEMLNPLAWVGIFLILAGLILLTR